MFAASKTAAAAAGTPPASTDPQFNYVTMLLHGDGTNGAQNNTFVDSSTNNFTITRSGTPTQGSFSPYGDLWSNYFGGVSDWMTVPASANTNLLGGDFTLECWFYPLSFNASNNNLLVMQDDGNSSSQNFQLTALSTGAVKFTTWSTSSRASFWEITSTTALTRNTWNHIAVTRSGNTTRVFLNGVQQVSSTNAVWAGASIQTCIGNWSAGPNQTSTYSKLNGYVSNVRMVKGTALYTSNFTPATTPLTAVSGTSLLTCQSNRFRDASSNNFAITVTGTPSVQRFSPFDPAAEYSTSVIGGSGRFPGTGNFVSAGTNNAFLPVFGVDFTAECWFYSQAAVNSSTFQLMVAQNSSTLANWRIRQEGVSLQMAIGDATISTGMLANQWVHVAAVVQSNTLYGYVNGVLVGSAPINTWYANSLQTTIGDGQGGWRGFNGFISDARIVKGTAVYTAAFTPPTAPLTAITNTSLLLNCVNAGIVDNAMMNDLVTVGNAQVSTSVKKYGTGSVYLDGAGDYLISTASQPYAFGTGNWTIEAWVNPSAIQLQRIYDGRPSNGAYPTIGMNSAGRFDYTTNSNIQITGSTVATTGTWYHVAVCRSGTSTRLFVNGVQEGSTYTDSTNYLGGTNRPLIGCDAISLGALAWNGYIDDLRVTNGVARYTANFTPPTAPFPNN